MEHFSNLYRIIQYFQHEVVEYTICHNYRNIPMTNMWLLYGMLQANHYIQVAVSGFISYTRDYWYQTAHSSKSLLFQIRSDCGFRQNGAMSQKTNILEFWRRFLIKVRRTAHQAYVIGYLSILVLSLVV